MKDRVCSKEKSSHWKSDWPKTVAILHSVRQILELMNERKELVIRRMELLLEEQRRRMETISKGRQLKEEARALKQDTVCVLLENPQRMLLTKSLLRRLLEQSNLSQIEAAEKSRSKKFGEDYRGGNQDLDRRIKKYQSLLEEWGQLIDKEKRIFADIERREADIKDALKQKAGDSVRRAEGFQQEIDKLKLLLRDNKGAKERKKHDVEGMLAGILDRVGALEGAARDRVNEIDKFQGAESLEDIDWLLTQFQVLLKLKEQGGSEEQGEKSTRQLARLLKSYQTCAVQIAKDCEVENRVFAFYEECLRSELRTSLLQKIFLQQSAPDRSKLAQTVKRCKGFRQILIGFGAQRAQLQREIAKVQQIKSYFQPKLRSLASEEARREELKKEVSALAAEQYTLEECQRALREGESKRNQLSFQRDALERDMDDCANKGNLAVFKEKQAAMIELQRRIQRQKETQSVDAVAKAQSKLAREAVALHTRHNDLIRQILNDQTQINYSAFIQLLSKRLALS